MKSRTGPSASRVTRASRASLTTLVSTVTGIITAILVANVPAWHNGLPYFVAYLIPILVGAVGTFETAYFAKHPVQLEEVESFIKEAQGVLGSNAPTPAPATAVDMDAITDRVFRKLVTEPVAHGEGPFDGGEALRAHVFAHDDDDAARDRLFAHEQAKAVPAHAPAGTEVTPGMGSDAKTEDETPAEQETAETPSEPEPDGTDAPVQL